MRSRTRWAVFVARRSCWPGSYLTRSWPRYTAVIIREADRLRDLVDRLLGPNQQLEPATVNIHEVLEHVRNLISAESDNKATICGITTPACQRSPATRRN